MKLELLYLQYLLYMNPEIGLHIEHPTQHSFAFKSDCNIRSCNRVYHNDVPDDFEAEQIIRYFGLLPFTWAVKSIDNQTSNLLEKHNFICIGTFPAMSLSLENINPTTHKLTCTIKKITINDSDISNWLSIVGESFNILSEELIKFLTFLIQKTPDNALNLYIAYYQNIPVATCMVIIHNDVACLHWIATKPEFRKLGLGYIITHQALLDAKKLNAHSAILLSSIMGKHLYESIGFKEYESYGLYVLTNK